MRVCPNEAVMESAARSSNEWEDRQLGSWITDAEPFQELDDYAAFVGGMFVELFDQQPKEARLIKALLEGLRSKTREALAEAQRIHLESCALMDQEVNRGVA